MGRNREQDRRPSAVIFVEMFSFKWKLPVGSEERTKLRRGPNSEGREVVPAKRVFLTSGWVQVDVNVKCKSKSYIQMQLLKQEFISPFGCTSALL